MIFRSSVDGWFYALILGAAALTLFGLVAALKDGSTVGLATVAVAMVLAVAFPIWLLVSTYYVVDEETLLIRSGPFRWRIPRSEIRSVQPSRSPLSSPALSLDRLEIRYSGNRSILVSPSDREAFMTALQRQT